MRTKFTLVLLFLNVALCFWIVHARHEWKTKEIAELTSGLVVPSEALNLQTLEIARGAETPVRLERHADDHWWITQPGQWPANPNAISHLVSQLQTLRQISSFPAAGLKLADYGLDKPALTLTFSAGPRPVGATATNPFYTLKIGSGTQSDNRLYLLSLDGTAIKVVDASQVAALGLSLDQLRDSTLIHIPAQEAHAMIIEKPIEGTSLVSVDRDLSRPESAWNISAPLEARANAQAIEYVLNQLASIQVAGFLEARDDPANPSGLDKPNLKLTIQGNKRDQILLVGNKDTNPKDGKVAKGETLYFAKFPDLDQKFAIALPTDLYDMLNSAKQQLRDFHILEFPFKEVTEIVLSSPMVSSQPLMLRKVDSPASQDQVHWEIVPEGLPPLPADTLFIENSIFLLQKLLVATTVTASSKVPGQGTLTANAFESEDPTAADLDAWGFSQPIRRVIFTLVPKPPVVGPDGRTINPVPAPTPAQHITLELGLSSDGNFLRARVIDSRKSKTIYTVSFMDQLLRFLPTDSLSFRERVIQELGKAELITGLTLIRVGKPDDPIYSRQLAPGETWDKVIDTAKPDEIRPALKLLLLDHPMPSTKELEPALLRRVRAKQITNASFTPEGAPGIDKAQPWTYQIDTTVPVNGSDQPRHDTLLIAEENSNGQVAGSKTFNLDFKLEPDFSTALRTLTTAHDLPPRVIVPTPPVSPPTAAVQPPAAAKP